MSFTAFKSLMIFSLLVHGEKSYADIQTALFQHEYLKEVVSTDTIRIYLNTLETLGCHLKKRVKDGVTYFSIDKHPFELNITPSQAQSLIKLYKAICKKIELSDLMVLHSFFVKIAPYITANDKLRCKLENLSPTSNIEEQMIKDLITASENNTEITIYYNAPRTGKRFINIVPDKLMVMDSKLYLCAFSKEYKNYSRFMVNKIIEITGVKTKNPEDDVENISVTYEVFGIQPELLDNERIVERNIDSVVVNIVSKNKFDILQRILFYSNCCKVLSPDNFKEELLECLYKMRKIYINE